MHAQVIPFTLAFVLALLLTPLVRQLSLRAGALAHPGDRTVHAAPVPLLGGLAIGGACLAAVAVTGSIADRAMLGIAGGAIGMLAIGVWDDVRELRPSVKLLLQCGAAALPLACGVRVTWMTNPLGGTIYLGWLGYPLTLLWIVGLANMVNFIDGLDGLAAGVTSIASLTLLFVAVRQGHGFIIPVLAALAGSALGFLPFNFNPAKIFMGDTGALFLGYMLAVVSVQGLLKSAAALGILVPLLAVGLPMLDMAYVVWRRTRAGQPFYVADKRHLHHRLLEAGLNQRQAVLFMYSVSGFFGAGAIAVSETGWIAGASLLTLALALMLYVAIRTGVLQAGRS
ncbi:MAG: MraY family glycosyltransferase [Bacillota bacterium]